MRTEEVYGRLYSGAAVITAVETDGERVGRLLDERYGVTPPEPPDGELAEALSYRRIVEHLKGDLVTVHTRLAQVEDEYQRKLARIQDLIDRRDEVGGSLSGKYMKVRHTLESLYGSRMGFVLANVSGATPQNPRRFIQQVGQTVSFLHDPVVESPSHDLNGVTIQFAELAEDLKSPMGELETVLQGLDRTRKEAQGSLAVKQEAVKEFDRIFRWVTQALSSYFHLAGLHELAELIRPSIRRSGRRAVDEEDAPENQPPEGVPSEEASPSEAGSAGVSPASDASNGPSSESSASPAASEGSATTGPPASE
jgi:hypothetical protein